MNEATVDYIELPATDLAATTSFYTEVFGWDWTHYGPSYAATRSGAVEVALNAEATPAPTHPPGGDSAIGPLVLLRADDADAAQAAVAGAGGRILSQIYPYPGGRRFHFVDPSGNTVGIYQPGD